MRNNWDSQSGGSCGCEQYWNPWEYQAQEQYHDQGQYYEQNHCYDQDPDYDQKSPDYDRDCNCKTIIEGVGNSNINVNVDNENILVAVLVLVDALLSGGVDTSALRAYVESRANMNTSG
ncbi:MAG TPA: hypothetical protein VN608_08835 [Clostridia bacterium]|nr:hypothetical protein [Clostridia bacterium]